MIAFVEREMQALSDGGDHLLRRLWAALLLEAGVVVGRHVAESGDLFAAETVGPAARARCKPHIFGLQ